MSSSSLNPKNVEFRYKVGKRMKEIKKRLTEIDENRKNYDFGVRDIERRIGGAWRETSSKITEPQVHGREEDKEKIVEFLVRHASDCEDLSIYPIVGMGGMGKTTLAQLVFNDERVRAHFDVKIWVCVSDSQEKDFNRKRILESIESALRQNYVSVDFDARQKESEENFSSRKSFKGSDLDSVPKEFLVELAMRQKTLDLDLMEQEVEILLQSKRWLLVLDDVWGEKQDEWDWLKSVLRRRLKGSAVLVTTRLPTVASIVGTVAPHHLSDLSNDDCWSLFKQRAFGPSREENAELAPIGKEIVKKCGGLPLAAKTLGSIMRFKVEVNEWLYVKDSELWDLQGENFVLPALRLSYFNLKLSLRRCFAFCAIFPKGEEIMKEKLIHLWMANGFISSRRNLELEDVGNEVWNELYLRSFFHDVKINDFGNITSFKMHDLFHDLAQFVMEEECVVMEAKSSTKLPSSTHHLNFINFDEPFNMCVLQKLESLRTLLQFYPSAELSSRLPTFPSLRALCTNSSQLSSLKNLIHLRYLHLYCLDITTLPESVCSLNRLQTLKLEMCPFLYFLPKHLARLQDLRHLILTNYKSLRDMPPNIGKLTCLKTLSVFIVGSRIGYGLKELHDLQLGGKLHIKGLENVTSGSDAKQANLIGKKDLHHLYLSWGTKGGSPVTNADNEQVLEALQPNSKLKSLGIQGYKGYLLPQWMRNTSLVNGLVAFKMHNCRNCDQLPQLGKLPSLTSLDLSGMLYVQHIDDGSYDCDGEEAFPSLRTLTLHQLSNVHRLLKHEGVRMLPLISKLIVSGVPKFIMPLPCLPSLQYLQLDGCNQDLLKSISNYHGLKFLCVSENMSLTCFPEGILRNLCQLKTLKISKFLVLKVLPSELNSLSALEELEISFCDQVESFPDHVLQGLSSLRSLRIEGCERFSSLSEDIGYLTCLEQLDISRCPQLVALPNAINQLTRLCKVLIWGNGTPNCMLPQGIERISCMQILSLSGFPELTSLPDCFGDLTSLKQIHIGHCPELRSLPTSFRHLTALQELTIDHCPKLKKRCKKGTGEDWDKIAHVPQLKLETTFSSYQVMRMMWKMRRTLITMYRESNLEILDDEFEEIDEFQI